MSPITEESLNFVNHMENVPAPYHHAQMAYSRDGLSCAMIAWMLDIDTRATTKKREFQRTYQKLCLRIKHLEGESTIHLPRCTSYTADEVVRNINQARQNFRSQVEANFMDNAPFPITAPIDHETELNNTVPDAQTFERKLHQFEMLRYMERFDLEAWKDVEATPRGSKLSIKSRSF
ncbi:hypothetical protein N7508_007601 [Penicillium antarcticum]|uniref:uncharacterized protein n=1 Tax=Penicillium antarcticum TaxID=416450 RepID=UPI0023A0D01A|nr:uncharacterized protein N7508_007601 [Penicillium antarcticum]KAJ5297352.1 hypothetical protein N7508_007601 [Penicillium antarcticum]